MMTFENESFVPNDFLCCICFQIGETPVVCRFCSGIQCHNCSIQVRECIQCNHPVDYFTQDFMIYSTLIKTKCKCEYCWKKLKLHKYRRHIQKCKDIHEFVKPVQTQFNALDDDTLKCQTCQHLALNPYQCQKCDKIYCYVCLNNFRRINSHSECCNGQVGNYKIACAHCNLITGLKSAINHLKVCAQRPKNYLGNHTIESLRNAVHREGLLSYKLSQERKKQMEKNRNKWRILMSEMYYNEKKITYQRTCLKSLQERYKLQNK